MKPINEMTDQELAEAVAVEVLGWVVKNEVPEFAFDKDDRRFTVSKVLSTDGRESIENELKRREWSFSSRYVAGGNLNFFEIWIPERGNLEPDYMSLQKSFYLAIAKAALMAVRGEASHGKD